LEESINNKRKGGGDSDNSTDNTTNKRPNNNNDVNGILRVIISNKFTDNSYIILLFGLLFLFVFTFVLLAFFQLGYI
jgi:hypothetical protein